ncbi:MAG TPA: hypothetical protein DD435_11165 [Cyanobacteria bacterium UBA8530]|nr:hypothetical protein [Cyanobacteria bacterium UBA8530]
MSHLHLPDGILPLWLVLSGWALAMIFLGLASFKTREGELRLARLGFLAALMIVAMSLELLPLAYHLNLGVLAGILLGPALGFLAAFLVDLILALLGHGGITVLGLNALILGLEIFLGNLLFRGACRLGIPPPPAAAGATVFSLFCSTSLMVLVVRLSKTAPSAILEHQPVPHFHAFLLLVYGLGSLGWLLEAALTAGIVRYLSRLRPAFLEDSC